MQPILSASLYRLLILYFQIRYGESYTQATPSETTKSVQQTYRRKSIAQMIPILNKFPVGSLSSGQVLFLQAAQPSLGSAGAFHAAPERSCRHGACASHVELGGPDGKI